MDKQRCFYVVGDFDLPVAGTPEPLPCPFCGGVEDIGVVLERDDEGRAFAHTECGHCGAESGSAGHELGRTGYDVVLEAARNWNARTAPVPSDAAAMRLVADNTPEVRS